MHIIYMHRSTPWLFIFGVYKCICGQTAVFFCFVEGWATCGCYVWRADVI